MDWGLFPLIFHGERSELHEKYGLGVGMLLIGCAE
jgi:hypothetical protein